MQRIKLMTDSACDLPGSLARQLGIEVIPIPIAVDGKGYLEGVDFTPREFYTILQQAKQIPTTSQISPVTYCERYHAAYQQGYTDVILMGISSTASATYLRSKDAADLFFENCPQAKESFRIHIIDSKTFSLGYGYPLTQAAQMIQDGKTAEEILAYLTDWVERIDLYITAFSFEFIKKSGRISCAASIVGEALGIRPVIRLYQGEITIFSKARGNNVVLQRIAQIAQDNPPADAGRHPAGHERGDARPAAEKAEPQAGHGAGRRVRRKHQQRAKDAGHRLFAPERISSIPAIPAS